RQLLDQEQFEKKLDALLQRQAQLESRAQTISGDPMTTGSVKPTRSVPAIEKPAQGTQLRPSPINDTVLFTAPPDREARLESRALPANATMLATRGTANGIDGMLARVTNALDKVEQRQTAALSNLEETYDSKARRIRSVLADLGVDIGAAPAGAGIGGPLVAMKPPGARASAFDQQVYRINVSRAQIDRYMRTLNGVPVRKPIFGEVDMSSPFGMRMDPFMKGPAIHTGIDLRGDMGDPVRVTANGRVSIASWQGGYGNMIEIDHGNGLATRYGHLSKFEVKVGDEVRIGQVIGRIGSTGR